MMFRDRPKSFVLCVWACTAALAFFVHSSNAALPDYGVVVGTVVRDTLTDIETTKNPHLEPQAEEGRYPHYVFYVDTPTGRYQCVIDIFSRTNVDQKQSIRYRVVPIHPESKKWDSTLNLTDGYHQLARDPDHGALDYFRHPGINRDAMALPWKWDSDFVVGVSLPTFDNLFRNAQRVWAFGQPYTSGLGIHNIHQNQGNVPGYVPSAPQGVGGEDHSAANGIWQDGAVILEYPPIGKWTPPKHWAISDWPVIKHVYWLRDRWFPNWYPGHWVLVRSVTLLMTQFQVQEDFTLDTATVQDGFNLKAGDGYTPHTINDFSIHGPASIAADGPAMEGQHSSANGVARKIRVLVTPRSGHPVLYGRVGSAPTLSQYDVVSEQPIGGVETIHAYSEVPEILYWRVFNLGPGPASFDWDEFDASE